MNKIDFIDDVYYWRKLLTAVDIDDQFERMENEKKYMNWLQELQDMADDNKLPDGIDKEIIKQIIDIWENRNEKYDTMNDMFKDVLRVIEPLEQDVEKTIDDEKVLERENTDKGNPFTDLRNQVGQTQQKQEAKEVKQEHTFYSLENAINVYTKSIETNSDEKIMSAYHDLAKEINAATNSGIITEEQAKELHRPLKDVQNYGFGHGLHEDAIKRLNEIIGKDLEKERQQQNKDVSQKSQDLMNREDVRRDRDHRLENFINGKQMLRDIDKEIEQKKLKNKELSTQAAKKRWLDLLAGRK